MSDQKFIKTDIAGGVARVTLARSKHNVLNIEMMRELIAALEKIQADREIKCVVISGEGPSWCAGVEVADHKPGLVDDMIATFNRMLELIEGQEVPTIAAVHGACLGGGMEAAIACDIIVAGQERGLRPAGNQTGVLPALRRHSAAAAGRAGQGHRNLRHRQALPGRGRVGDGASSVIVWTTAGLRKRRKPSSRKSSTAARSSSA